ncbi:MAG TPA: hypothetical protein VH105_16445 [Burkholderiales bacterium]|jgi:hypothetical protein|nr:hypothetical protein [Burkholderiales bacterium]
MKLWLPVLVFVILLLATAAYFFSGSGLMPERVAVHFAADGSANGFMTREGYRQFLLEFGLGVPLGTALIVAVLPALIPTRVNLPYKNYWMAPERRAQSLAFLSGHGFWLGCLLLLLMSGVHRLVVAANAGDAAAQHLDNGGFAWVMGLFGIGIALWAATLMLRFRKPPA